MIFADRSVSPVDIPVWLSSFLFGENVKYLLRGRMLDWREDQGVGTVRDRDRCELRGAYGKPLLARSQNWCERLAGGRAESALSTNGLSRNGNWQRRKQEIERSRASAFLALPMSYSPRRASAKSE